MESLSRLQIDAVLLSLVFTLWFIKQLLFHPTPPQSGPAGASGAWLGVVETQSSLEGVLPLFHAPPPPQQTRPAPLRRCSIHLLLIVSVSGRECATWWRVTFWTVRRLFSFVPHRMGLEIGQQKRSPDVCCGVQHKSGANNGFSLRFSWSMLLIKGHKRLNGCKIKASQQESSGGGVRWRNSGLNLSWKPQRSTRTVLFFLN